MLRGAAAAVAAVPLLAAAAFGQAADACDGRPISGIRIATSSLFAVESGLIPGSIRSLGNALHWRTRPEVVRREVRFREGEPCDPELLRESERLLRQQPYLRSVRLETVATDSGLDVEVVTSDDWTLTGSVRVEPGDEPIRRFRITEENLLGRGMRAQLRVNTFGRSPRFELGVLHRQAFRRADAEIIAGLTRGGETVEQTFFRPFEVDRDRFAWRESGRFRTDLFEFKSARFGSVTQPYVVSGADAGVAARFGKPGALRLVGVVVSWERLYLTSRTLAARAVDDSAAAAELDGVFAERRVLRANVLLGLRSLRFNYRRGLDAVNGREEVPEGVEVGLVAGHGFSGRGGLQPDRFVAAEWYLGVPARSDRALLMVRGKVEGRRTDAGRWENLIGWGELLGYGGVGDHGSVVVAASLAGGWRMTVPFQLLLSGPNGMRGYGYYAVPVGRRAMVQAEHRWYALTLAGAVDVGTALFVEAGRGWSGGAAYAADTGTLTTVGGGLRVAFPSGSRVTYRLDLAIPLRGAGGAELRVGLGQQFGVFQPEPDDLTRSREQVSSANVFNFPR